jgi:hypothetical protein
MEYSLTISSTIPRVVYLPESVNETSLMHLRQVFFALTLVCSTFLLSSSANAQITTTTNQLLLSDGNGHGLRLTIPSSGWPGLGTIDWTLPLPPTGVASGFVQSGDATNNALQWDNVNSYWKAVPASAGGGGISGSGTDNFLPKWTSNGTALTNSLIQDDGATIRIDNGALLIAGGTGATPTENGAPGNTSVRLMWVPERRAFRAGEVNGIQWDDANIGMHSVAFGNNVRANGDYGAAFGNNTVAASTSSFASGWNVLTVSPYGAGIGRELDVRGTGTIILGQYASNNGFPTRHGCFMFGDNSTTNIMSATGPNQFYVRAVGGTRFYTSADYFNGVELVAGGNSWASISDSNKKANRLNISGEAVLNKLSNIWLGSWNYRSQDKSMRHYGPMAQEFFAAFGNDGIGIIGNDTTLATADVDGVTLIAVKGLDARTREMQAEMNDIRTEYAMLRKQNAQLMSKLVTIERTLDTMNLPKIQTLTISAK